MIIGLMGGAGFGKDTLAEYLSEMYGFKTFSFAATMKNGAKAMFPYVDFDSIKDKEAVIPELGVSYRHLLQTLGTEWGRNLIDPNVWVKPFDYFYPRYRNVVVTDCRFHNERNAIMDAGGVMVRVSAEGRVLADDEFRKHQSEAELKDVVADYSVDNTGSLEDLYLNADTLMKMWGKPKVTMFQGTIPMEQQHRV